MDAQLKAKGLNHSKVHLLIQCMNPVNLYIDFLADPQFVFRVSANQGGTVGG